MQTTFEIMKSQMVLSNVIASMNLNEAWGKKYYNGETLKTTETMEILKGRMGLAPVRNTKMITITVYSDDKKEAADLANNIAQAYQNYRVKTIRRPRPRVGSVDGPIFGRIQPDPDHPDECGLYADGLRHR